MAVECSSLHKKRLKMYGFGISGQGFYSIEIPDKEKPNKFSGLITVLEGIPTGDKLDEELKNLVDEKWDFQVREMSKKDFRAVFSDQVSLDTFAKLTAVELSLHGLKVKISKSNIDPAATCILQTTWVKVSGIRQRC